MMENPPLLNGGPVIRIEGTVGSEPLHERDQAPGHDLTLGAGCLRVLLSQQRLDPALGGSHVPRLLTRQPGVTDGRTPVARQQPPLGLALGVERKQRLQALAKAAAASLRLIEPGAGPLRDGLEGGQQQVALVGEVVRQDGRARSGGVSDVAEGQRLQAAGSDKLGGGRGDVAATRVVVDVSRH
jgi:hypothetical protein